MRELLYKENKKLKSRILAKETRIRTMGNRIVQKNCNKIGKPFVSCSEATENENI